MKVATRTLSSLDYSHNSHAKLLPFAEGIFDFACGSQRNVFDYKCRLAATPSYSSMYQSIQELGVRQAKKIMHMGNDRTKGLTLTIDNVQSYVKRRDMRLGRENEMKIGVAATMVEGFGYEFEAVDFDEDKATGEECKDLTVEKLTGFIDHKHLDTISALHWLRTLVHYVLQLAGMKSAVADLFKTKGRKLLLEKRKSAVHPLGTSNKNEAVTTDLKDAMLDFFEQLGQAEDSFSRRFILVGGDGMTFKKLLQLQRYMQVHGTEFQSFKIMRPFLELWHTLWTDLCRIFETHWGDALSDDPSTLGFSATKINQKTPPNLKKVDYYPGAHLVNVVLDARMLDCWR
jgi:hypothetical protein